ncbi:MAG: hypothetical protein IJP70_06910 [Bacteroidales bacterium]|nr:hypothetical protein [Bacteroidales bacterium]
MITLCPALKARDLWVGGMAGISYANEDFSMALAPQIGVELNEKWAVAASLGYQYVNEDSFGYTMVFLRYNLWNKNDFYIDGKLQNEVLFGEFTQDNLGVLPSLRYRFSKRWEASADIGFLGVSFVEGESYAAIAAKNTNLHLNICYHF